MILKGTIWNGVCELKKPVQNTINDIYKNR